MSLDPNPDRALLRVKHTTRLLYEAPVVEAYSEVRKAPVDTGLQRVITSKLELSPQAAQREHRDYYGNRVHHFSHLEPHDSVRIHAESVVETSDGIACGPEAPPDPRPWRQRLAEFLQWSPMVPALPHYARIEHGVSADMPTGDFLLALPELGERFGHSFRYDPDATDVHSTPEVLFETGGGVCQDLAHAMLGVLRLAGVPSRYASGYIYDPGLDDGGESTVSGAQASHAWVQVWHADLGWVGIDPTNRRLVDWQYVRVSVGRDYGDVRPMRGVFRGPPGQKLEVEVRVTRLM